MCRAWAEPLVWAATMAAALVSAAACCQVPASHRDWAWFPALASCQDSAWYRAACRACCYPVACRACRYPVACRACCYPVVCRACCYLVACQACCYPVVCRACCYPAAFPACCYLGVCRAYCCLASAAAWFLALSLGACQASNYPDEWVCCRQDDCQVPKVCSGE